VSNKPNRTADPLIDALYAAANACVRLVVEHDPVDASLVLRGRARAGQTLRSSLPDETRHVMRDRRDEIVELLRDPTTEERRTDENHEVGGWARPSTFPFREINTLACGPDVTKDDAARDAYLTLRAALAYQDARRVEERGDDAEHGLDVRAARAWRYVVELVERGEIGDGGRWSLDMAGACVRDGGRA
jgi:hypothetical protein